jgi:hypothetical protein
MTPMPEDAIKPIPPPPAHERVLRRFFGGIERRAEFVAERLAAERN